MSIKENMAMLERLICRMTILLLCLMTPLHLNAVLTSSELHYVFAGTSFEDCLVSPYGLYMDQGDPDADHELINNAFDAASECSEPRVTWPATDAEIGFTAWYHSTGGIGLTDPGGDYFGVSEYTGYVGSYTDGVRGYQMGDTDGIVELRFDTVTNTESDYWDMTVDLFAADTEWENVDQIEIMLLMDDDVELTVLEVQGDEVEAIAGSWLTIQQELTGYTSARLSIKLASSVESECIFIDRVRFNRLCEAARSGETADCNGNGIADSCEIGSGLAEDCNGNDIPDSCDLLSGLLDDLDADGLPDECYGCNADIQGDGQVNVNDVLEAISNWGPCDQDPPPSPQRGLLDRWHPEDLRIMSWNMYNFDCVNISDERSDAMARVLLALDPDVIVFQEIILSSGDVDASELRLWLEANVGTGPWYMHDGIDTGIRNVIASRLELDMLEIQTDPAPLNSPRGATMARVDCPDDRWSTDLYLIGVHFKAFGDCDSELKRQGAADSIANWIGDLRTPGDVVDLPVETPIFVLGDMNFYSHGLQPERTLLNGDIMDEDRFGPDIPGDWDGSGLTDLRPAQLISGETWTLWGDDDYEPSRTDRLITTNSVLKRQNMFVLNTTALTSDVLDRYGLQLDDTTREVASDHLPVVVDLRDAGFCTSDVDDDGVVGVNDILEIIASWGFCP